MARRTLTFLTLCASACGGASTPSASPRDAPSVARAPGRAEHPTTAGSPETTSLARCFAEGADGAGRAQALRTRVRTVDVDAARASALEYLGALAHLGEHGRIECFDVLESDVGTIDARVCPESVVARGREDAVCGTIARIECDVAGLHEVQMDSGRRATRDGLAAVIETKLRLWRRFGLPRAARGLRPYCDMDQIVDTLVRALEVAGRHEEAHHFRGVLADPRNTSWAHPDPTAIESRGRW